MSFTCHSGIANHHNIVTNVAKLSVIQRDGIVISLTMYLAAGSEVARSNLEKLKENIHNFYRFTMNRCAKPPMVGT